MLFLIRFWRSLTKKYSVESAKYEEKCCLLVLTVSEVFYSWIRIFWIGSRFLADPDREKNRIQNIDAHNKQIHCRQDLTRWIAAQQLGKD